MAMSARGPGGSPVGLSIGTAKRRLFIGCRKPKKKLIGMMSTDDGKGARGDLPIARGVDATKFRSQGVPELPPR
jgi:hypothetical protein